jgi:hypothetical protein
LSRNSAELGGRDVELDGGRGGNGEVAVAKSSVAMSSVFPTGTPHEEQKRTLADNSEPQDKHLGMKISRYRINQAAGVGRQASEVRPQTSDLRPIFLSLWSLGHRLTPDA